MPEAPRSQRGEQQQLLQLGEFGPEDRMTQPYLVTGMGSHQSSRMLSDVWLTPPEIVASLGRFDLDPCATPIPRPWPTAGLHITLPDNGLAAKWNGRVWLNPPYSREVGKWLGKLASHGRGTALVFARTETSWFVDQVWAKADALLFLHGRLRFYRPDGIESRENAGAPSVLAAYGLEDVWRLQRCELPGSFVSGWQVASA